MKKIILAILLLSFLVVPRAHAATMSRQEILDLISSLIQQILVIQAKLNELQAQQQPFGSIATSTQELTLPSVLLDARVLYRAKNWDFTERKVASGTLDFYSSDCKSKECESFAEKLRIFPRIENQGTFNCSKFGNWEGPALSVWNESVVAEKGIYGVRCENGSSVVEDSFVLNVK